MSETKLMIIIGITGQQGGSVARVLQNEPGWRVRGITRNPSKYPELASHPNIDLVSANLDDPASLASAFAGADAIFSVTDFWQFLSPNHATFTEAADAGVLPNRLAMEKEVRQGRNIVDAAAAAHAQKPLHRFVMSTLSDSKKWSGGEIDSNLHFDGKAHVVDYLKETYPGLATKTSYLQIGYYLTNWNMFPAWRPHVVKGEDGEEKWIMPFGSPVDGRPIPFVHAPNDTGLFVKALLFAPQSRPGTTILGTCEPLTPRQFAEKWGRVMGKKAEAKHLSRQDLAHPTIPDWLVIEVSHSGEYVSKYGWDGGEPGVKSPAEAGVDVSKLTKVEEWIKKEDWSSIM